MHIWIWILYIFSEIYKNDSQSGIQLDNTSLTSAFMRRLLPSANQHHLNPKKRITSSTLQSRWWGTPLYYLQFLLEDFFFSSRTTIYICRFRFIYCCLSYVCILHVIFSPLLYFLSPHDTSTSIFYNTVYILLAVITSLYSCIDAEWANNYVSG